MPILNTHLQRVVLQQHGHAQHVVGDLEDVGPLALPLGRAAPLNPRTVQVDAVLGLGRSGEVLLQRRERLLQCLKKVSSN
jgi:hypothetical protein